MNPIDTRRHLDVFSNVAFGSKRVDVIGAGATGSRIVLSLAKLGIENLHVWDFDVVESHNIANQAFGLADIGKAKVEALRDLVKQQTGLTINIHNEKVDGSQTLGDVVFLLTDTMASRKEIWTKGIRFKMRTRLMIETRMGPAEGRCYALNPSKPAQVKGWEGTLYGDEVAQVSACGASITVGPTAEYLSGLAVWQLIRWFAIEQGKQDKLDHEIIFGLRPLYSITRNFD
jgi:molybdopterin/thiamine biosynthesis adenylyltransferase